MAYWSLIESLWEYNESTQFLLFFFSFWKILEINLKYR